MTVLPTLAVTGVTGVLGGSVARALAADGVAQRLLARTPARAPQLPGSTVHPFSYSDRPASVEALTGVETLFMVSASESADRLDQHRTFVDAAAAAGVRHIVYTSFVAAAPDAVFTLARDHGATEEHIRASGMAWTFLRDSFYIDFMEALVGEDGVIRGPGGDGRVAIVSRADVARTAVAVLRDPSAHAGRTYDLTGPEALSFTEIAATIARVRGREVSFRDESLEEAYASRAVYGAPDWQVDAWVSTYTAVASGGMAAVSDAVETVTGVAPQSLEAFLASTPR
ncbi:SDR family oxidoreductase [Rathayibacter sp. VKM Ac-2630]|uniref:SDR family oxidoreductase n=1 Tax=Rathayibacter sp. VKM Ac-2630 TaxID=1938617 RepID=UPI000980C4B9|nr:SDR family oxidoreductase [Rathayibacter sp. VKM Ac-2630]OOB90886.1 NAD(P)-dependent oxidoreductase [Rathayibacter sp. VKM Ac-2630]